MGGGQAEHVGLETNVAVEYGQGVLVMESFVVQNFRIVDYVSSRHFELPRTNTHWTALRPRYRERIIKRSFSLDRGLLSSSSFWIAEIKFEGLQIFEN